MASTASRREPPLDGQNPVSREAPERRREEPPGPLDVEHVKRRLRRIAPEQGIDPSLGEY
jgi:hypothetical protein